jgi:hypothetical protein
MLGISGDTALTAQLPTPSRRLNIPEQLQG